MATLSNKQGPVVFKEVDGNIARQKGNDIDRRLHH